MTHAREVAPSKADDERDGDPVARGIAHQAACLKETSLRVARRRAEPPAAANLGGPNWSGVLLYYRYPNATTYGMWDENRRMVLPAKNYSVCTTNQRGQRWFFVRGNAAGIQAGTQFNIQGQIQN